MKIALIAGEASGDRLGGRLMVALRHCERSEAIQQEKEPSGLLRREDAPRNDSITFSGIGGVRMEEQGLHSLFPMQELSLMGFAEVLPHARRLKRRIREVVEFIEREQPDMLVTIDSPGFNCRVVKLLCERGRVRPRLIHYVAPTVWAYKPKRAAKMAALFDHLLVLLPFEPPYFEREGLATTFVGHPVTEDSYNPAAGVAFREKYGIAPEELLLCVMPGSRKGELTKLLPVFTEAVKKCHLSLRAKRSNPETKEDWIAASPTAPRNDSVRLVIPATAHSAKLLEQLRPHWPTPPIIVVGEEEKRAAMVASDVALAKSGTVTLEAAMAGLPMITAYKVNPISAWMLRRMITTRYVNLINILEDREVIPELLQEHCTANKLAASLAALWQNEKIRAAQRADYKVALNKLSSPVPGRTPSSVAAQVIISG